MEQKITNLDYLFNPQSIAIVGASTNPQKLGSVILSNVIDAGFKGHIYPINPKENLIQNLPAYPSVKEIPGELDVACLVIPKDFIEDVIDDCIEKKVKGVIIISAGFSETGQEGKNIEERIAAKCKLAGIRIIGPNCLGILSPDKNINISFAASHAKTGNIAFLSQSGAFCTAMLDFSLEKNLGFYNFVSVGNKADVSEIDLIEYWADNKEVKVIAAYVEEIVQPIKILQSIHSLEKPVIILKPGESNQAKEAIASHTGSMAGSAEAVKKGLEKAGAIHVKTITEMFNTMMGFSWSPLPKGNNVAILTNAGGPGIIATDAIVAEGLNMAKLSENTVSKLKEVLPPAANFYNPVDVIGDSGADRYSQALETLIADENVDSILVILTPQIVTQIEETAKAILHLSKSTDKPIFATFLGQHFVQSGLRIFYDFKLPAYQDIHEAVKVIKQMTKYSSLKTEQRNLLKTSDLKQSGKHTQEINDILKKVHNSDDAAIAISEELSNKIAQEFDIPMPKQLVSTSQSEIVEFAKDKYPVALKATTADLAHKTDQKAVFLNIKSQIELEESLESLDKVLKSNGIKNPNFLIQEFIAEYEPLFVGANRDGDSDVYETQNGFGHLLALGYGGIYAEIFNDIELALLPASRDEVLKALEKTSVWQILKGARGKEAMATEQVLDFIMIVQKMLITYPQIKSLDFNPILVTNTRLAAVDIKIFVG